MAFYIADLQVGLAASRGYRIANERRCFSRIILVRLLGNDRQGKNQNCGEQRAGKIITSNCIAENAMGA
jgi:hypothetical protein